MAGTIEGDKESKNYNEWTAFGEDETDFNKKGVILKLAFGTTCLKESSKNFRVTYRVQCNSQGKDNEISLDFKPLLSSILDQCEYEILGSSKHACPILNYYIVSAFFDKYSSFLGIGFIIIGLLLVFLGYKFLKVTIVATSGFGVALLLFLFIFNVFSLHEYYQVWIVLAVGLLVGLLIGYFLLKLMKICFFIIGGCFGYTVGVICSTFILEWITWNPEVLYWIVIVVFIIGFGLLTMFLAKHAIITATSFMGAYLFCRGISLYAGGFPDEGTIIDLIKRKEWDKLEEYKTPAVYGYLAGVVVLACIGIAVQERINLFNDKDDDHENADGYQKIEV